MPEVYRAPMRSRRDDIDLKPTIDRALAMGHVGFGDAGGTGVDDRLERRVTRFGEVADGSFVWTRDTDGLYWLGRIEGPLFYDDAGAAVDLVHVRPCRWTAAPVLEPEVPPAVLATFARGGRNFQQTHDADVGEQSAAIWRKRENGSAIRS
ncbi:GAF domain-containing protein [Mycobacterium sp. NPDC051804]|uniref:GAF domain-containing protein n=1 Tax=Mycobacterium sp. NPDC051804 TaxID=3364295 RepID=UPI0037924ABC